MMTIKDYSNKTPRWVKLSAIAFLIAMVILFVVAQITRNYIENHAEEWIGRKVSIGSLWLNPLNSSLSIDNLKVFEKDSDTAFLSFSRFYINTTPYKYFFGKRIVVTELSLVAPHARIVMNGESFNFDDLLERFASNDDSLRAEQTDENSAFTFEDISISYGGLNFYHSTFQGEMGLEAVRLNCPLVSSDNPDIQFDLSMGVTSGGVLDVNGRFDQDSLSYAVAVEGKEFNIGFLLPFIDKIMYVTSISGTIDTQLNVGGNFNNAISEAKGIVKLSAFQLLDTLGKPSVALDQFEINIDTVSAIEGSYRLSKVKIDKPYLRFDLTESGNNLMRNISEPNDSIDADFDSLRLDNNVEDEYVGFFRLINDYFYDLATEYAINFYSVDSLSLQNGHIQFNDYTLNQQFNFLFENLDITASNVQSDKDTILVEMKSSLNRSGIMNATVLLKPKSVGDMYAHYTVNELKVSDFSPYSEYYVAHPFWDGVVFLESTSEVKNHWLESQNKIVIRHLEVGDKVKNQTALDLPLKLAVSLLKDVNGDVDLSIPVKGDVNDPKFRLMPIVLKIFKDLIVKAAASPYKILARTFNANEDDLRDIKYDYLQYDLRKRQTKGLNLLARILNQKKDMQVQLIHLSNAQWEMDQYALFEAKRMYYVQANNKTTLNFEDTLAIDRIQRLDSAFTTYLRTQTGSLNSIAEIEVMATQLVGKDKIQQLLSEVELKRKALAIAYLQGKVEDHSRFTIIDGKPEDLAVHRERPKFLIQFETAPDAPPEIPN